MDHERIIVLIGISGAGKSNVGMLLAKATRRSFLEERGLCEMCPSGYLGFSLSNEVLLFVNADSAEDRASEAAYRPLGHLRDGMAGKAI